MNTITKLLNLEDSDIYISDIKIEGTSKIITLETHPTIHFCPQCDFRMLSRGIKLSTLLVNKKKHECYRIAYCKRIQRPVYVCLSYC